MFKGDTRAYLDEIEASKILANETFHECVNVASVSYGYFAERHDSVGANSR